MSRIDGEINVLAESLRQPEPLRQACPALEHDMICMSRSNGTENAGDPVVLLEDREECWVIATHCVRGYAAQVGEFGLYRSRIDQRAPQLRAVGSVLSGPKSYR